MKIISLSILSIALSVSLSARENPFEPTDHFLEQKEIIIKANEQKKMQETQDAKNKIAQEMEAEKLLAEKKAMEMAKSKQEAEAKKMAMEKAKAEMLVKKENEKKAIQMEKMKTEPVAEKVVMKKAYVPEIKENFKVLPFVKIYVVDDVLTIKVDTKYKLLNQDILKPVKKLLFDFEGKVSFYTVRKDIISESFKSLAVGTHMEENYFRVVIDLPEDIINYIEKVDSKNGIITITKKK